MSLYLPAYFSPAAPQDQRLAHELIDAHPFALLVSVHQGEPFFTHCPVTLQADPSDPAAPVLLEGHLARANPHWKAWQAGEKTVTAIFQGPQAYVSPTLYAQPENVPTWNYTVVHVRGQVELVTDTPEHKDALLKRLIAKVEPSYAAHWRGLSPEYQQRMLGAIVGFRLRIERLDAKFKLSQNRQPVDRQRVHDAFAQGDPTQQSLAAWMRAVGALPAS